MAAVDPRAHQRAGRPEDALGYSEKLILTPGPSGRSRLPGRAGLGLPPPYDHRSGDPTNACSAFYLPVRDLVAGIVSCCCSPRYRPAAGLQARLLKIVTALRKA